MILPVFNFVILSMMLYYELKSRGNHLKSLKEAKLLVIVICAFMQVIIFCHYSMASEITRIFLQLIEEACKTLVFFWLMDYFLKQAKRLLKYKQKWNRTWKLMWAISLIVYLSALIYTIIIVSRDLLTE